MTRKFWKDWQNRFGETDRIYLNYMDGRGIGGQITYYPYKIKDARFYTTGTQDFLSLTIEEVHDVYDRHILKTVVFNLNRKDIATVTFKKTL